jgi:mannose-6-phosphate isomerase-like protein (cupin superfamily)
MRIDRANFTNDKGWYAGPWDSSLPISIGYANTGIDELHLHTQITEIYLIARGTSVIRIERETVALSAGDILIVEPGEAHTFLDSSPDYFHFVIHFPGLAGDAARSEKTIIHKNQLGLD